MRAFKTIFFTVLLFLFSLQCFAAKLKGKISDENNQPVPFVAVYVEGTTQGTISNIDGEYVFELQPGTYKIEYQLIGYATRIETVVIGSSDVLLNIQLKPEGEKLADVTISANSQDPAFGIIRHAIKMRKNYLEQVNAYSCDVYIKGVQRIKKHPQKLFGQSLNFTRMDSNSGIIYLSESVSKFNFMQPDKMKEEMISSKVSGNSQAFSYNQESDMLINFYQNNITIDELSERGFISPIANDAMFYYNYRLDGTITDSGRTIDKIEVIPKRRHDPVFRGYIYIMEDGWRIYNADLYLCKDAEINFVDTLFIKQSFLPVKANTWMLFSTKLKFTFNFLGIVGEGVFVSMNSNYNIDPKFPRGFFNGEVMKIDTGSNKKDTVYWRKTRPVPLTHEETHDYHKRDSMQKIYDSKPYLDSIDRRSNKFHPSVIILGQRFAQRYKKRIWYLHPLVESVSFNTVQGWCAGLKLNYVKEYKDNKRFFMYTTAGYGFSDKHPDANLILSYGYNPEKRALLSIGGGIDDVQFNNGNPISPFINSIYTLFEDENYIKLYRQANSFINHRHELVNGVYLTEGLNYSDRILVSNNTNYRLINIPGREYSSNELLPLKDSSGFVTHSQSLSGLVELSIHFKQEYMSVPNQKFLLDSKYPVLTIDYRKAGGDISIYSAKYDFVRCSLSGKIGFKLLGTSEYSLVAGKFLNSQNVQFMDYNHFNGNQTIFSAFNINTFQLLPYYTYSTMGPFAEGHFEHNFQGFIFNKFPLLRKLKLDEIVGVNYLTTNILSQYFEVYAGISKLDVLRFEVVGSYAKETGYMKGIRLGISL
ncbi:MAG TPA: DUF5686 and carboxypeptidase regulatory-like domain-containing protein [Bacteroidia bacterium]|nr:DUF5686 and carboxypeptidase regulatory-like domain-containing protein [Bacteroidia bacterium]